MVNPAGRLQHLSHRAGSEPWHSRTPYPRGMLPPLPEACLFGSFLTARRAAEAYDEAATELHGDKAVLNFSVALGTDAESAAIQMGKALNDPILGISALGRAGVQFTESQKEMIATLVESGDVVGAQSIILAEFDYNGAAPSFPLAVGEERWIWWAFDLYMLKPMYWHLMMRGLM